METSSTRHDVGVSRTVRPLLASLVVLTAACSSGSDDSEAASGSVVANGVGTAVDVAQIFAAIDAVEDELGSGQEYFEVLTGLSSGDIVVAGPYQRIRQLREGDAISVIEDDDETEDEGS